MRLTIQLQPLRTSVDFPYLSHTTLSPHNHWRCTHAEMSSGYDPYYDALSPYSHPLASRNSSSTTTTSGPRDDFRASRYAKGDDISAAPTEVFYGELSRTTTLATSMERGGSSQSDANSRTKARVGRRGTTKELIGRYESMSSDGTRTRVGTSTGFLKDRGSSGGSIQTPENKGRGRSPIRQSLRNLLSVFSKKEKLSSRESSLHVADLLSPPNGIAEETHDMASLPLPPPKRPSLSRLQSSPQQIPVTPQDFSHPTCTTPIPMYSGRLFHLCPPVVSGGLPIWAECDVVLHSSHVLITWHSNSGNPSTSAVQIGQCTDVRSLNPEDLGTAERSQLPDNPDCGGLKIFELLFIGQSGEKFAARSLQERAGWVSAVWSVVFLTAVYMSLTYSWLGMLSYEQAKTRLLCVDIPWHPTVVPRILIPALLPAALWR